MTTDAHCPLAWSSHGSGTYIGMADQENKLSGINITNSHPRRVPRWDTAAFLREGKSLLAIS